MGGNRNERDISSMHQAPHPRNTRSLSILLPHKAFLGATAKHVSEWTSDGYELLQWRIGVTSKKRDNNTRMEMTTVEVRRKGVYSALPQNVVGNAFYIQVYRVHSSLTRACDCPNSTKLRVDFLDAHAQDPYGRQSLYICVATSSKNTHRKNADSSATIGATIYRGPTTK